MPSKQQRQLREAGVLGMEPKPSSQEIKKRIAAGGIALRVKVPKRDEPIIDFNIVLRGKEAVY